MASPAHPGPRNPLPTSGPGSPSSHSVGSSAAEVPLGLPPALAFFRSLPSTGKLRPGVRTHLGEVCCPLRPPLFPPLCSRSPRTASLCLSLQGSRAPFGAELMQEDHESGAPGAPERSWGPTACSPSCVLRCCRAGAGSAQPLLPPLPRLDRPDGQGELGPRARGGLDHTLVPPLPLCLYELSAPQLENGADTSVLGFCAGQ